MDFFHLFAIMKAEASKPAKGMKQMTVFSKNLKNSSDRVISRGVKNFSVQIAT